MIGSTLSHYTIEAVLGQGGMGTVYRARDTWLGRTVAIKVLSPSTTDDLDRAARMLREAKAASSLNHPNIVTIHEFDRSGDVDLIVMEHVDGQPLSACVSGNRVPIKQLVDYAHQIASALAAAHDAGIVHRDVKPGNLMVRRDGRIKVLDFGLARHSVEVRSESPTATLDSRVTGRGAVVGSIGYMAPEQIEGKPADTRSDVFSLGVVMFEMLTGHRPFTGDSDMAVLAANLKADVPAIGALRSDAPRDLRRIVARCLARKSEDRYPSARELAHDLDAICRRLARPPRPLWVKIATAALAGVIIVLAGVVTWIWVRESRLRWVRNVAIPELRRLDAQGDNFAAFLLFHNAREIAPDDPQLAEAWSHVSGSTDAESDLDTDPQGAEISVGAYGSDRDDWYVLGTTPLKHVVVPFGVRWRARKPGYDTIEASVPPDHLVRSGTGPRGMVLLPAAQIDVGHGDVEVPAFWMDAYEVTNRQFKEFISNGGYGRRELWNQTFVKDGRPLSWTEALAEFHDATGRPGPSTWNLGTYPEGQAEYPVSGVSWYEAMAYATYVRKSLPSVYQWYHASGAMQGVFDIARVSNFSGQGPARVGQYRGLSWRGTDDMAGNVKEWCTNATSAGRRYTLGGAWYDASYQFRAPDARPAFERRPGFGFRCVKSDGALADSQTRAVDITFATAGVPLAARPVADEVFSVYRRQFDYDRTPLHAKTDSVDDGNREWRQERVSFDAAYGAERVPAALFLPRASKPPYETVIFFPAAHANFNKSSQMLVLYFADFLVQTGRALVYPIYQGTYERRPTRELGPNEFRDVIVQQGKDLRRTIDYLETRTDIDVSHLAYEGLSNGAMLSPLWLATEPRLRMALLVAGGLTDNMPLPPNRAHLLSELDPASYAPRVTVPVLMVNGRWDFLFPYESAQVPLFAALGTAPKDKRHVVIGGDHFPSPPQQVMKEILDWLDRYQGPVKPR